MILFKLNFTGIYYTIRPDPPNEIRANFNPSKKLARFVKVTLKENKKKLQT